MLSAIPMTEIRWQAISPLLALGPVVRTISAPLDRDEVALGRARVDLTRARDLLLGIAHHFLPLGEPAGRPRDREEYRKHLDRKSQGLVDHSRVEVDIRIELARDEVIVLECDPFELTRDRQERARPGHGKDLVRHSLDDPGPRVVVLVDPVTESHELGLARLHLPDELG